MVLSSADFYSWGKDIKKRDFWRSGRCAFEEFWFLKFLLLQNASD
jgi:hypothetical protein